MEAGFDLDKLSTFECVEEDVVNFLAKEFDKSDAPYSLAEDLVIMFKGAGVDILGVDDIIVDVYLTEIEEVIDEDGDVYYDVSKDFYDYYTLSEMNKMIDEGKRR